MLDVDPGSILDIERLRKKFGELSNEMLDAGTEAGGKYLLRKVKDDIPPYKYVSRKQAYGRSFFSPQQRAYVMAAIRSGEITKPYKRTNAIRDGWKLEGSGRSLILKNEAPGVEFAYGETQANQLRLVGWRRLSQTIDTYVKNVTDSAARAIEKLIRSKGL